MASGSRRRRSHRQARTSGGALRAPASLVRHARDAIHATGAGTVCPRPQRLQLLLPLPARVRLSAQTPSFATSTRGAEKRSLQGVWLVPGVRRPAANKHPPVSLENSFPPPSPFPFTPSARGTRVPPPWRLPGAPRAVPKSECCSLQGSPPPPLPASATPRCTPRAAPHGAKSKSPVPHRARCVCGWGGATEVGEVKECIGAPSLAPSLGSQILSFPETLHKKALSFPPLLQKAKHSPAPHSERARSTPRVWPMPMGPAAGWSAATELRDRVR